MTKHQTVITYKKHNDPCVWLILRIQMSREAQLEDRMSTQRTSIPVLDLAVIKGIEFAKLASAPDQSVHNMLLNLQNTYQIISM
jgi:hypothetical protein